MRLGVLRFTDVTESALTEAAIIINGTGALSCPRDAAQNRPRVCTRPPSIVAYSHAAGGNPWCLYDFSQYQSTYGISELKPNQMGRQHAHATMHHNTTIPCSFLFRARRQ
jgi:hypothetical protein